MKVMNSLQLGEEGKFIVWFGLSNLHPYMCWYLCVYDFTTCIKHFLFKVFYITMPFMAINVLIQVEDILIFFWNFYLSPLLNYLPFSWKQSKPVELFNIFLNILLFFIISVDIIIIFQYIALLYKTVFSGKTLLC